MELNKKYAFLSIGDDGCDDGCGEQSANESADDQVEAENGSSNYEKVQEDLSK